MISGQSRDFAARTLEVIGATDTWPSIFRDRVDADRDHVRYFLCAIERAEEGLRGHRQAPYHGICLWCGEDWTCPDARYWAQARDDAWAGLQRTARLYGVRQVGPYIHGPNDTMCADMDCPWCQT